VDDVDNDDDGDDNEEEEGGNADYVCVCADLCLCGIYITKDYL
jgi:hypothetical protein